jgi:Na+-driven multidrug efflux pump
MPFFGLQTAASLLIGKRIGAQDVINAKIYQKNI